MRVIWGRGRLSFVFQNFKVLILFCAALCGLAASGQGAGEGSFEFLKAEAPSVWSELQGLRPQIADAEARRLDALRRLAEDRKRAAPLVAAVEKAKEAQAGESHWWQRWWLDHQLRYLQQDLDALRQDGQREEKNKQELFSLYSAVDVELSALAEKKLAEYPGLAPSRRRVEKDFLRSLFRCKEAWSARLARLGFSEQNPYPLAAVPEDKGNQNSALQLEDQVRARQARAIQLEAWQEQVGRERQLLLGFLKAGALDPENARTRLSQLKALSAKIHGLSDDNQLQIQRTRKEIDSTKSQNQGQVSNF